MPSIFILIINKRIKNLESLIMPWIFEFSLLKALVTAIPFICAAELNRSMIVFHWKLAVTYCGVYLAEHGKIN